MSWEQDKLQTVKLERKGMNKTENSIDKIN